MLIYQPAITINLKYKIVILFLINFGKSFVKFILALLNSLNKKRRLFTATVSLEFIYGYFRRKFIKLFIIIKPSGKMVNE